MGQGMPAGLYGRGRLVVAAPAGMDALPGGAELFGEGALDGEVAVLVLLGDFEGSFARVSHNVDEARHDGVALVLREEDGLDGNPRKHGDMRG